MTTHTNRAPQVERVIEVDAYEQELFDDVATLFLDQAILLTAEEDATPHAKYLIGQNACENPDANPQNGFK